MHATLRLIVHDQCNQRLSLSHLKELQKLSIYEQDFSIFQALIKSIVT